MQYDLVKACGKQSLCFARTPTTPSCNTSHALQRLTYDGI